MSTSSGYSHGADKSIVSLHNVSLRFRTYADTSRQLKQTVLNAIHRRRYDDRKEFWLYRDLNLTIKKGERVGIVGSNGAGKSTLLKLISGIYHPTAGTVRVCGRISPLIELGAGFNMELSGAENILLNGAFLGFSRSEMSQKIPRILEFAELVDHANVPIKYYSSGMLLRLAFSIATDIDPEILLIDEIFAAGDASFVERATERMKLLMDTSHVVVMVSHNMQLIQNFCSRAIWLRHGHVALDGRAADVCAAYLHDACPESPLVTAEREMRSRSL